MAFSGLPDWRRGLAELIYSAAMWTALFALCGLVAEPAGAARARRCGSRRPRRRSRRQCARGRRRKRGPFQRGAARVSRGTRGRPVAAQGNGAAALAACGALGLVLSYRRPFHIGDSAYVAPPLLFALVCAAGLLHLLAARPRGRGTPAALRAPRRRPRHPDGCGLRRARLAVHLSGSGADRGHCGHADRAAGAGSRDRGALGSPSGNAPPTETGSSSFRKASSSISWRAARIRSGTSSICPAISPKTTKARCCASFRRRGPRRS